MKIAVLRETQAGEKRVAATPDSVKRLLALGFTVTVEKDAGSAASYPDKDYEAAGASIAHSARQAVADAAVIATVRGPAEDAPWLNSIAKDAVLLGLLNPHDQKPLLLQWAAKNISAFALELLPRITRAQSMDVLSSQSNLAGYRAVIEGAAHFGRAFPMMMTAAGTIAPARVLVLGAGVAGLQAIATARRMGAVVSAFDVRPIAKEQVQSLGATFIEVEQPAVTTSDTVYAKEMDDDYKRRQHEKITETLAKTDIVIATALIPGRPAPVLLTAEMLKALKPGSVIADLAAERGGNCAATEPGTVTIKDGVTILGFTDWASRVAVDASALYARNIVNFLGLLKAKDSAALTINRDDEIINGTLLTHAGQVVHPQFQP